MANPGDAQALQETVIAAGSTELYLHYLDLPDPRDIEKAFQTGVKGRADGVLVLGNPALNAHRKQIVELALKYWLPTSYTRPEYIEVGGLMYYGPNYNDLYRRAAGYVDKILKGTKPVDIPVELPTKFELVLNKKTAKRLASRFLRLF